MPCLTIVPPALVGWLGTLAVVAAVAVVGVPLVERWTRPARTPPPAPSRSSALDRSTNGDAPRQGRPQRRTQRHAGRGGIGPAAVAGWLDDVARSARAGAGSAMSLIDTPSHGALDTQLAPLRRRLASGDGVSDAVTAWRRRLRPQDEALDTAAAVLLVADEVGGSFAVPLERAAALLRSQAADEDERASWSSQARLSAKVMAALPVAALAFLALLDGSIVSVVTSPAGAALIGAGLLLDAVGFVWMHRIVERAGR